MLLEIYIRLVRLVTTTIEAWEPWSAPKTINAFILIGKHMYRLLNTAIKQQITKLRCYCSQPDKPNLYLKRDVGFRGYCQT